MSTDARFRAAFGAPLATALLALSAPAADASCRVASAPQKAVLVELYTSQGCSSCPPADRWLSSLPSAAGEPGTPRLIALSLHVGYWDYLGWSDPFARREFNERQRWLAGLGGSGGVYTPGVFVAGVELRDWRDARQFAARQRAIHAQPAAAALEVDATLHAGEGNDRVKLSVQWRALSAARDPVVWVAAKRSGFTTPVRAGENRGEQLKNDHVVRAWSGPFAPAAAPLRTELVLAREPGEVTLVVIAQDRASGTLLQAVDLPLRDCGKGAGG